jgi:type II secretory pathway pseudopilin PulG
VEVLVVIAMIAVLAGLLFPVLSSVQQRADRTVALSQMRQIYGGISLYAADHNNHYPGPLWPGQIPLTDPTQSGRLVVVLAPYVGINVTTTPQLVSLFIPPAYRKAEPPAFLTSARTYVMNMAVPAATGGILNPWGNITVPGEAPIVMGLVPITAWAFSDADQLHPRVLTAPWKANTPRRRSSIPRFVWPPASTVAWARSPMQNWRSHPNR